MADQEERPQENKLIDALQELVGPDRLWVRHHSGGGTAERERDSSLSQEPLPPAQLREASDVTDAEGQSPKQASSDSDADPASTKNALCDRCDQVIAEIRFKCQTCPDFDYCPACYFDSARIHPGHEFKPLNGFEPLAPGQYQFARNPWLEEMKQEPSPLSYQQVGAEQPQFNCSSCWDISLHLTSWHSAMQKDIPDLPRPSRITALPFDWTVRLSRLAEATSMGCAFCGFMLERFFGPGNAVSFAYFPERPWYLESDPNNKRREEVVKNAMELYSLLPNDRARFKVSPIAANVGDDGPWLDRLKIQAVWVAADWSLHKKLFANAGHQELELHAFVSRKNPASSDVVRAPPNPFAGSTEAMIQVRSWLSQCLAHHGSTCSARRPGVDGTKLPSRVIDVSGPETLRLYEPASHETGAYCALSYQWGGPQELQLTATSIEQLKEGFPVDHLPATVADAVKVTQNLGIRYLWVDALCILQDDEDDRGHEISHMEDIYRFSHLTIVAARSSKVTEGFLQTIGDTDTGLWNSMIPLKYPIPPGALPDDGLAVDITDVEYGTVFFMDDMQHMNIHITKDPVANRSWCLQERLLSPRVLTYGRWPTWRCGTSATSDGGFYLHEDLAIRKGDDFARLLLELSQQPVGSKFDHFTLHKLLLAWYGVVQDHSKRRLSLSRDRLPAIGGVASLVGRVTDMNYLAGLWQDNLLHDLMWYADTREWMSRPAEWRAPTWSWASVDTAVSYGHIEDDSSPLAKVIACEVVPGIAGPFGEVTSGKLRLRGLIRVVSQESLLVLFKKQNMAPRPPKTEKIVDWYRQMLEGIDLSNSIKPVTLEETKERLPVEVSAMVTFKHDARVVDEEHQDGTFYSGLLLRCVDDHYERIGSFKHETASWLDLDGLDWRKDTIEVW